MIVYYLVVEVKPKVQKPQTDVPQQWVDKYKPKTIKDIIGQQTPNSNCAK